MILTNNFVFLVSCVIGFITIVTAQGTCPDISPCTYEYECVDGTYYEYVVCNATMLEVKTAFRSLTTPITMRTINLYIQPSGDTIPEDIFGESMAMYEFYIIGNRNFPTLTVHPNAFRSSTFLVENIEFKFLDMGQVDFQFLSSSTRFDTLTFSSVSNLHQSLPTLPPIPALSSLTIENSAGLNQPWQNGDVFFQSNGLLFFYADNCGLDDVGMSQFLDWMIPNAAETLEIFHTSNNRIRSIPRQLMAFQSLNNIQIYSNLVELTVPGNSFNGTTNKYISLTNSRVIRVEPGAFLGNYSSLFNSVLLNGNLLTRLEEDVFKSVLQDMTVQNNRGLFVSSNPFDCYSDPCHLAWLLRDNRLLLNSMGGAEKCENGTYLEDLSQNLFQNCP